MKRAHDFIGLLCRYDRVAVAWRLLVELHSFGRNIVGTYVRASSANQMMLPPQHQRPSQTL